MGATDNMNGKSADERRDDFAKKNADWDRRVKSAVSELDKVADKAKRAAGAPRRSSAA